MKTGGGDSAGRSCWKRGVTLSVGLEDAANLAALLARDGTGGISDDTLIFLLEPSSETLRTMVEYCKCSDEKGAADFKVASKVEYGACTSITRFEYSRSRHAVSNCLVADPSP